MPVDVPDTTQATVAAGYYCDSTDLENRIGTTALRTLSNLDNSTTTADYDRVQLALDDADLTINLYLRRNGYQTPVATTSADFAALSDAAAHLAAVWLYDRREWREESDVAGQRSAWAKRADERLQALTIYGLQAARLVPTDVAPPWPTAV